MVGSFFRPQLVVEEVTSLKRFVRNPAGFFFSSMCLKIREDHALATSQSPVNN